MTGTLDTEEQEEWKGWVHDMLTFDILPAVLGCQSRKEANQLVDMMIENVLIEDPELTHGEADLIVRSRIGYWTGSGMAREESQRIMELFLAPHPYFGGNIDHWPKTPEETVKMGYEMGRRSLNRQKKSQR